MNRMLAVIPAMPTSVEIHRMGNTQSSPRPSWGCAMRNSPIAMMSINGSISTQLGDNADHGSSTARQHAMNVSRSPL